jgi:energy-coupling factor transporter ATP-binding protein EcfA2
MEMNEESILAWNIIEKTNANLFLTGKAGTGKTTFLKRLKELSPKRMIVLAPTGIAAINAGGMTIHSFFQLPFSPYVPGTTFGSGEQKRYQFSKLKRNIIRSIDLLVIDEISMVRSDLLDAVDSVLRQYRKRHDLPFGGVQLLMIGDLQQLAPVVTPQEEHLLGQHYDTPFFFSSNALKQVGYLTIELKKVYRQQDEQFISLLNQIRENKASEATLQALNQRYIPFASVSDKARNISITFQAPSKTFNIAGIVSSYAIIPNEDIRNRFYKWLSANELDEPTLFAPIATIAAFRKGEEWRKAMLAYIEDNIRFVENYCREHIPGIRPLRPQASFLVWLNCRDLHLSHDALLDLFIDKAHLALNDGEMFGPGGEGFMRLNVAAPRSVIKQALQQLEEAVSQL